MADKRRILVVDDEVNIVDLVTMGLQYEGFETLTAHSGREGLSAWQASSPDLVILDLMLPDQDGIAVCRTIRAASDVPILMLTARSELDDKVLGLDSGADDYLTKPFRLPELLARVRALLRRRGVGGAESLQWLDVTLDPSARTVTRGSDAVALTPTEFNLLELLMRRPRQVFTREQIISHLWGWDFTGDGNVVDVHVSALRARLGDTDRRIVRTVRGIGYGLGT